MPPCGTQDDENMMVLWRRSLYWSSSSVAPHRTPFTWGGGVCSFRARDFRSSGSCAVSIVVGFHPAEDDSSNRLLGLRGQCCDGESAGAGSLLEGLVILLHLVGVSEGIGQDGFVKVLARAQIARDHRGIPGFGVGPSQRLPAETSVSSQESRSIRGQVRAELHVSQLADIEILAVWSACPTQKDVAGRLHQP